MICLAVSPHLDDAVLCAGGHLARRAHAGIDVVVVTVCAGNPPDGPLSAVAAEFHADCGLGADVVGVRRAEDAAAVAEIGAVPWWLDVPDGVYRRHGGHPTYGNQEELFGPAAPTDRDLAHGVATTIAERYPHMWELLVPLGVGGHVDHRVARQAGEALANRVRPARTVWYEESPYAAQQGRDAWADVSTAGLRHRTRRLDAAAHRRKRAALSCYRSQMPMLRAATSAGESPADLYSPVGVERLWSLA